MKPYYEDEHVTLYHGDSIELADYWLDADVLVTDPPYGTQFTSQNPRGGYGRRQRSHPIEGFIIANDTSTDVRDKALDLWGTRPVAMFGSPRQPEPPGGWADRIVWDKVEPGMNGGPFRYTHENIYMRGEGWERTGASSFSILRYPRSDGMGNAERSQHPHRKPVGLMEDLIRAFPSGIICDPFAGSGSTLVAANNLARKAVGVEISESYCELIAQRLSQGVLNLGVHA